MLTLTGYTIEDKIYESDSSIIYRGIRKIDNSTVILKLLKEEYPSLEKVSRFMHEYEILKILDEAVTVAVYDFIRYKNSFVIILKDGGQDLQQYLDSRPRLQLSEAVQLAIGITESLDNVHKRHIIHKDVNPSNILLDSSIEKIKVIDFGISSKLPKEMLEVFSLNQLEGTLDYMSPEQTGRMNRGIDYRSDYYSLGATFYQIFTGVLPFTSKDTLELVYSHIAKLPASPSQVDPAIPKIISDIIMKLLEKTAEKRYQSGYGLITDLQNCLLQLQKTGLCNEFPLGLNDYSGRFQVPDKLYGRESEINYLLDTFSRVSSGSSELMLVAGYSGIGKSSLVHEVHKPIVKKHGYFISGKFDLLKRNIPYAPFVQAFEGLIQQILTENKETVDECKEKIIAALGPNGGVMTEVLPSLVKIIGEQAPIIALGPMETQNRFISVFQNFVHTLATEQHPLVIFLDDLQWVDLPSLKLLQSILSQTAIKYLLIVGAYRDNEVNAAHPLMLTIDNFKKMNIPLNTLTLGPLKVTDVQQLLTDTLSQEPDVVQSLAVICHAKTLGNPFFLNQFLRSLCDEDLITFNTSRGIWHWVIEKVKTRTGTDNVVEVVINNIQKLLPETRSMLAYAACLGHRFDLQALSVLYGKSPKQTAAALEEALSENFILPIDESYRYISEDKDANAYYQFLHDRVQQAAYTLPTENEKKVSHLKIGRYYIQNLPVDKQEELLFDIVNQINLGIDLITMPDEKLDLARLNLRAGRKAKSSAAYSIALDHFHFCLGLLPPDAWSTQYDLTLELHTEAAEAAYLSDNFVETERLSGIVFSHAHSILDQVKIYEINIYTSIARNKPSDAVVISLEVLKKLGIKFPKNPNQFHAILSILKTKWILMGKSNDRLVNLPVMSDPFKLNACNILSAAIAPTYYAAPALYPLFTLALLNLSIQYGYNKGAPAAYASYGIILCGVLGEINRGHTFGQLALNLIEYFQAVESEAKVALMVSGFVNHWKEPYRNSLAPLLVAHLRGIEAGDLDFSAYSAYFYIVFSLYAGVELNQIAEDTKKFHQVCLNQHTHGLAVHSIALVGQVVESLQGLTTDPSVINGSWYKGETMLQEAIDINHGFEAFHYYVLKIMLSVFFYNFDAAHQAMLAAPAYISAATGGIPLKAYNFYGSLARIALCENATTAEKRAHLKIVAANQKQLKHWMKSAPENCLHKYYLVEAELARLHKKIDYAEKFYDKAMQLSKQYEFVQEHALASELAAKFYLAEGKEMVAKGYMTEAYYSYTKWGAVAKLRH
ncbi:MAG: serine/threonine-protein kinase PknK, partial [Gammaproteobacteria bacterium]